MSEKEQQPDKDLAEVEKQKNEIRGLNRRNTELEKEMEIMREQLKENTTSEIDRLRLENDALIYASEHRIPAKMAVIASKGCVNHDELMESLSTMAEAIESQAEEKTTDEIKKRFALHDRKPAGGPVNFVPRTYKDLLKMTDAEQRRLTPEKIHQIIEGSHG